MLFTPTQAPIERLGLVAQYVTGFVRFAARRVAHRNGKTIRRVVLRRRHRQADHQGSFLVECFWRKHQEGMDIAHFLPSLRAAVDPDDVLPVGRPAALLPGRGALGRYQRSAPSRSSVAIASPPWIAGS